MFSSRDGYGRSMTQNPRVRTVISATAQRVVDLAASTWVVAASALVAVAWFIGGVVYGFTQPWMSVMVGVTSVVTFVMVFFIQHTTDRQSRALMLKLDELIRATSGARDELIAAERRSVEEQEQLEEVVRGGDG